ncbi:unnamed protein product, partial [Meganyctiphanes norvegica]
IQRVTMLPQETKLVFSDTRITVTLNSSLELSCGYGPADATNVREQRCLWKTPQNIDLQVYDIYDNVHHPELSAPNNTDGNQCGIVLNSVSAEDLGNWTCIVPLHGGHLTGTTELALQNYMGLENDYKFMGSAVISTLLIMLVLLIICLIIAENKITKSQQAKQRNGHEMRRILTQSSSFSSFMEGQNNIAMPDITHHTHTSSDEGFRTWTMGT